MRKINNNKICLRKTISSVLIVLLFLMSAFAPVVTASISPPTLEATLKPGESVSETKTIVIPELPHRADVIFAFDLTETMSPIINNMKANAGIIMTALASTGVDINYGVVSYMDYPASYNSFGYSNSYGLDLCGDYAYRRDQSITSDTTAVRAAINHLNIGCGEDGPEDYTRIMYESYSDPAIGWRAGAKKILINFGDNVPHDNDLNEGVPGKSGTFSTGGDPGRNGVMDETSDPSKIGSPYNDDLNLQTVLSEMAVNNVILLEAHRTSDANDYWAHWTGITGGNVFISSSGTIVTNITNALTSPTVSNLHLQPEAGYESWLTSSTPASYSCPAGETVTFDIDLTVPSGTPPGDYTFIISAIDDAKVSYGDQSVTIHVQEPNNLPPVAEAGGPYTVDEGSSVTVDASGSSDPDGDTLTYTWDLNNDGTYETQSEIAIFSPQDGPATLTVGLQVSDGKGISDADTVTIKVNNVAPTVDAGSDQTINEGNTASFSGSFTDPGTLDTHTIEWDFGDGSTSSGSLTASHVFADNGVYTVKLKVTDKDGAIGEDILQVTINNVAPIIDSLSADTYLAQVGTTIKGTATFHGSGTMDTLKAEWNWEVVGITKDLPAGSTSTTDSYTYTPGGV